MTEMLLSVKEPMTKEMALAGLQAEDPEDAEALFDGLVELGLLRDTEAAWEPKKISSTYPTTPTSIVL